MPRKQNDSPPANNTERRFLDALERLKRGAPQEKKLLKLQGTGKLKINFTTVAIEADRSRRLIAMEKNCPYPKARAAVLAEMNVTQESAPTTKKEVIKLLREQIQLLRLQLRQRDSENVALVRRLRNVETNARAEISEARRLAKRGTGDPGQIAGGRFDKEVGKVVDFPKQKDETEDTTEPRA